MKKIMSKPVLAVMALSLTLSACARDMASNTYTSGSAVGKVLEGTVISAQPVTIKENDKLQDNTMGMLGGGVVGGIAGSGVGGGTGQVLATAGGALAGAALGSLLQDKLGKSQGMQYVVRLDPKYVTHNTPATQKTKISVGDNSVDRDVQDSISTASSETDLISVIQGTDVIFAAGQKVLVIYNNDRPRLAAAQ